MCKMRVAVLREMLGNRELCWTLWNGKEVMELTARQIKDCIKKGNQICGLMIGKSGELEFDKNGFFTTNIMEHRHCGNYVPMVTNECVANLFYIVIGSHIENGVVVYDCISTKFEQTIITESDLRAYLKIGIVSGGARLNEKEEIEIAVKTEKPLGQEMSLEKIESEKPLKPTEKKK